MTMRRSRFPLALAGFAVVAGMAGCGRSQDTAPAQLSAPSATPPAGATGPMTPQRRETIFLDATAAHLCAVQSRVYTDPSAMAKAFASGPIYQDLTDAQVRDFQQRLLSDPAFAGRLTDQIHQTCGTQTP